MKVRVNLLRDEMVATGKLAATKANFVHLFKGLDDEDSDIINSASKHVHEMHDTVCFVIHCPWVETDSFVEKNA